MSSDYRIAETPGFRKKAERPEFRGACEKARAYVYPQLSGNPFYGPNIKKLKGVFAGVYRYRIGAYRFFYIIRDREVIVVIIDIEKRKDAYK